MDKREARFINGLKFPRNGNYFNFRHEHIIIGWRDYDAELMKYLVPVSGGTKVRIHIFLGDISKNFQSMVDAVDNILLASYNIRVMIHIPKTCKDIKDELLKVWPDQNKRRIIMVDHKDTLAFRITEKREGQGDYTLLVKYEFRNIICSVVTYFGEMMKVSEDAPVQNEIQAANPDKYKKDIIARFKASTPLGILKSFKDENDIWKYINNDKDWNKQSKPVETIHVSTPINIDLTDELMNDPDKAVEAVGQTAGQKALEAIFKGEI